MQNTNIMLSAQRSNFNFVGWKACKQIKKKAMEQEFSWSGLFISLSIAFFVVFLSAYFLSTVYKSFTGAENNRIFINQETQQTKPESKFNLGLINKIFQIPTAFAQNEEIKGEVEKYTYYLSMQAGEKKEIEVRIKNIGKTVWQKDKTTLETGPFLKSFSKLQDKSWIKYYQLAKIDKDIKPGQTAIIKFALLAPDNINGTIQENYYLVINNNLVLGTEMRFFTDLKSANTASSNTVVQNNAVVSQPAIISNQIISQNTNKENADFCIALSASEKEQFVECQTNINENDQTDGVSKKIKYNKEPILRIGIFNTDKTQRLTCSSSYSIYAGDTLVLKDLTSGYISTVSYSSQKNLYTLTTPGLTKYFDQPLRFVADSVDGVFTLLDFKNPAGWNKSINYNQYRNIIEFNFSLQTVKFWIINELPINYYIKGLAETSNYSPVEYQKVIATAARTYALYHYNRGVEYNVPDGSTKHASEHFHLDATYDQVYKGYVSEKLLSKLSQAVDETSGIAVTYNDKVVVTPYFSRSDGRTRGWQEVWYGEQKPWLVSVAVPQEKGQELWGHGVGLSASAALIMARDEGKKWQDILKYFYSGIQLQKIY